jgi:retron-type reverse transcriptase
MPLITRPPLRCCYNKPHLGIHDQRDGADIANCFSAIPHEKLMPAIEERVSDQGVLKLLRAMLRAGVMQDGSVRREAAGTPQGGPLSPLLGNVYLHRLDRVWDTSEHGVLVPTATTWW